MADITVSADIHSFMQAANAAAARAAISSASLGANTFTGEQIVNQGAIVASTPNTLSQTWNNAAIEFKALVISVTQTAFSSGIGTESKLQEWRGGAGGVTTKAYIDYDGGFLGKAFSVYGSPSSGGGWVGIKSPGDTGIGAYSGGYPIGVFNWFDGIATNFNFSVRGDGKIGFVPSSTFAYTAPDAFFMRKAAATIQLGVDAEGVTHQHLTAASRITTDGVGANLTLSAGNGRGGAGGSLIFSTYTTAGAATAGTLTTRLTLDTSGILTFAEGVNMIFGSVTGTQFGTGSAEKMAFWGAGPTSQPAHIADSSGDAGSGADTVSLTTLNQTLSSIHTAISSINSMLASTGLTAAA